MAKKKSQPQIENRRHAALSRKEAEQKKQVYMLLGGVAIVILLILAGGLIYTYVVQPRQPIAVVNDTEISKQDYQKRVLYERYLLDEEIALTQAQYQQMAASLQDNPELLASFEQQIQQQLSEVNYQRLNVDRQMVDQLIEETIVLNEAEKRGITVPEQEVDEMYENIIASRSGGYTEAAVAATVVARETAAAEFQPLQTPAPTSANTDIVPEPTAQPTPTINVIAGATFDEARAVWEKTIADEAGMTPDDLKGLIHAALLQDKLREAIGADAETMALQAHIRHILVETEEDAQDVLARLEAGEEFADLAAELSNDPSSAAEGGDIGWFPEGVTIPEIEEAAFSLEIDQISEPIQTQFGYHILQVLGRGERELEGAALARAQATAYNDWLLEMKTLNVEDLWSVDDAPPDDTFALQQ